MREHEKGGDTQFTWGQTHACAACRGVWVHFENCNRQGEGGSGHAQPARMRSLPKLALCFCLFTRLQRAWQCRRRRPPPPPPRCLQAWQTQSPCCRWLLPLLCAHPRQSGSPPAVRARQAGRRQRGCRLQDRRCGLCAVHVHGTCRGRHATHATPVLEYAPSALVRAVWPHKLNSLLPLEVAQKQRGGGCPKDVHPAQPSLAQQGRAVPSTACQPPPCTAPARTCWRTCSQCTMEAKWRWQRKQTSRKREHMPNMVARGKALTCREQGRRGWRGGAGAGAERLGGQPATGVTTQPAWAAPSAAAAVPAAAL